MVMQRTVTYSEMNTWGICGMKHWYAYMAGPSGFGIQSVAPYLPYLEGNMLHHTLKIYRDTGQMQKANFKKKAQRAIESFEPDEDLLPKMNRSLWMTYGACVGYREKYNKEADINWWGLEKEFSFNIGQFEMRGKIDGYYAEQKDMIVLRETKFRSAAFAMKTLGIPLNLQELMYCYGVFSLTGNYPAFIEPDIIFKTQIRPKKDESQTAYENRVAKEYTTVKKNRKGEVVNMFHRIRKPVENRLLENGQKNLLLPRLNLMVGSVPDMREESCVTPFSTCEFLPACIARMEGKGDGWDSPQCGGLYRPKPKRHMELEA